MNKRTKCLSQWKRISNESIIREERSYNHKVISMDHSKHEALCYPFVKWAGGKTQLLPILNKHIPSTFGSYFEPFLGGGAMFFFLFSKNLQFTCYLSDINDELINAYKVVKNKLEELLTLLRISPNRI